MNKTNKIGLWLFCLAVATSCLSPQHVFVTETNPYGWSPQDEVTVPLENTDTSSLRTLDVVVRYDNDFEYDRLNLLLTTTTPNGYRWCDTITVSISDKYPNLDLSRDVSHTYRHNVCLSQSGRYLFSFTPLPPTDSVVGIVAVGIDIYSCEFDSEN